MKFITYLIIIKLVLLEVVKFSKLSSPLGFDEDLSSALFYINMKKETEELRRLGAELRSQRFRDRTPRGGDGTPVLNATGNGNSAPMPPTRPSNQAPRCKKAYCVKWLSLNATERQNGCGTASCRFVHEIPDRSDGALLKAHWNILRSWDMTECSPADAAQGS